MKFKKLFLTFLIYALICQPVLASMPVNPSYVSTTGSGSACTIGSPCSVSYANSNADAGDTVYLRGGTYSTTALNPSNSGTSISNLITFEEYTGETVIFSGMSTLLNLSGKSWIKIKGIDFHNPSYRWANIDSASHHIFIYDADFNEMTNPNHAYNILNISGASNHIYFYTSTFDTGDFDENTNSQWDNVSITNASHHIMFDTCNILASAHAPIWTYGEWNPANQINYVVIKNSYISNKWRYGPLLGGEHNLIEDSEFNQMGERTQYCPFSDNPYTDPDEGDRNRLCPAIYLNENYHTIIRRNRVRNSDGFLLPNASNQPYYTISNLYIYNNSIYDLKRKGLAGHSVADYGGTTWYSDVIDSPQKILNVNIVNNIFWKIQGTVPGYEFRLQKGTGTMSGNKVKYNIFGDPLKTIDGRWNAYSGTVTYLEDNSSEWEDNTNLSDDPLYIDPDNGNLSIPSNSPGKDAGTPLTVATNSGSSSKSLTVADAKWFYDGWGFIGEEGDYICIGSVGPVQIDSINYSTNTITLKNNTSWSTDPVRRAVSSTVCYFGTETDLGYQEVEEGQSPDVTAPDPNPATFDTAPYPSSFSGYAEISMIGTTLVDPSTPGEYSFDFDPASDDCGSHAHIGTGGSDSGWQASASFTDDTLEPDHWYCYAPQTRDSVPNTGTAGSTVGIHTLAYLTNVPVFSGATGSTLNISSIGTQAAPGNPSWTRYALQITSTVPADSNAINKWVQANGTLGASKVFQTKAQWENPVTISGLETGTTYGFQAKSMNFDDVESTNYGTVGYGTTTGEVEPAAPGTNMSGGVSVGGIL